MKCYLISYNLKSERDYTSLYEAIKSYGVWAHILKSTWAIVTDQSAKEIREYLKNFIDQDDKIFVIKSGGEAAWKDVLCTNEWLKNNL